MGRMLTVKGPAWHLGQEGVQEGEWGKRILGFCSNNQATDAKTEDFQNFHFSNSFVWTSTALF